MPVDCRPNGDAPPLAPPLTRRAGVTPRSLVSPPVPSPTPVVEPGEDQAPVLEAEPVAVPAGVRKLTTGAVVAVAVVAAAASYEHMRHLAAEAGEGWRSWLLPVSVDGLVVAASMSMLVRRRTGEAAGLAWVSMVLGLAASLAANVIASDPSLVDPLLVRRVVAAWPPLALLLAYELLMQQVRGGGGSVGRQARSHAHEIPVGSDDGNR